MDENDKENMFLMASAGIALGNYDIINALYTTATGRSLI
jgi:hypothetical protein